MTTAITKTFESSVLVETRELDSTAGTFTRRDGTGLITEQRDLNPVELDQLNLQSASEAREAAFQKTRDDARNIAGNGVTKQVLLDILAELEALR